MHDCLSETTHEQIESDLKATVNFAIRQGYHEEAKRLLDGYRREVEYEALVWFTPLYCRVLIQTIAEEKYGITRTSDGLPGMNEELFAASMRLMT